MRLAAILAFAALLLAAAGWLGPSAARPETLPVGARLPDVAYVSGGARHALRPAPEGRTLVVLYHSRCGHCEYELGVMDRELHRFGGARIVLLTPEDSVATGEAARRWPRLASAGSVTWGAVDGAQFAARFGSLATPQFFVADADGTLHAKFMGETRLENLLRALRGEAVP